MQIPVRPGDVLAGKYRIERVLGHGGMGVVVAARHLELGELYAIKFLLPEALTTPDALDRFMREARASARLKGEHIAKVHDVGRLESGLPYMVMEFLAGSDLNQVVRQRGPLPVEEVATYALQVCEALAEAHSLGIIHRDIKPANLFLIQRPNGTPCIKVLDFGISKQITAENVDLTKTGMVMGSPLYMAPEQMLRSKGVDARSDVWAMGVVFYKLLTGATPFTADTTMEVAARVLQEPHVPPSHLRSGLPVEVDAITARCLEKKPEHRFQSINELAVALRPLTAMRGLGSHDTVARAPFPSHVSMSQPELAPGTVSQPETGSTGVTASVTEVLPGSNTAPTTWGQTAPGSNSSKGAGKALAAAIGVILIGSVGVWFALRSSPNSTAQPQSNEVAPQAPVLHQTAAPPVIIAATSAMVEAPATSASNALADASSGPGISTSAALTRPPTSNSVSKRVQSMPSPAPPSTTATKKSKYEGVY